MNQSKRFVFVVDPVEVYRPVEVVTCDESKGEVDVVEILSNQSAKPQTPVSYRIKDTYPIASFEELNNPPPDLIKLMTVNLPCILNALKHRFMKDSIYTSVGPILVALNPFKWIQGVYDEALMMKYYHETLDMSSDPHVFAISAEAFQGLQYNANQSLIISGESGAGKTETTKQCLNYLARVAGSSSGVQNKILLASPILEAWGNAKTLRNNNSSRFGKFIEIWFDKGYRIVGSSNTTYLLEKSRVVFQEQGERNYHVFYQLLRGGESELIRGFHLEDMKSNPTSINYLNQSGCIDIEDVDDGKDYREVQIALNSLGFSPLECHQLWTIVAIVLHLGNIEFVPNPTNSDEATVSPQSQRHLDITISLMKMDAFLITQALLKRRIQTGGKRMSISFSPYTVIQAIDNRNSLVKEIYNRTFDWIVAKINSFVNSSPSAESAGMIGVLDIFGFEIFKKNSFEQLCINLANEALQQHFNFNIFRVEMELYRTEEIPIPDLSFNDNQDVLDLIMKKPLGIIPILDEEGLIPRGTWEGFLNKLIKAHHPGNKRFKNKQLTREFGVVHYAGEVIYDPKLFLAKNKDSLAQEIIEELSVSQMELVSEIFRLSDTATSNESSGSSSKDSSPFKRPSMNVPTPATTNKMTVGKKFAIQLESLVQNLNNTKPHYIRCIKPNDVKKPNIFLPKLTNEQLTYSGVFEAVIILQSGYPFRLSLFDFRERYHMLVLDRGGRLAVFGPPSAFAQRSKEKAEDDVLRHQCDSLIKLAIQKGYTSLTDSYLGKTKVFYRAPVHYYLVRLRNDLIARAVVTMQRYGRGFVIRKLYRLILHHTNLCVKAIYSRDMKAMDQTANDINDICMKLNTASPAEVNVVSHEANMARGLYNAMLVEVEVVEKLKSLLADNTRVYELFDEITATLSKAKTIISFQGTVRGVALSHTWQQNPYLVESDLKIQSWEDMVNRKREIFRGISENDEVLLERLNNEINLLRQQNKYDGVVDLSDVISPMLQVINSAKKSCEDFLSVTFEKYRSEKVVITGVENDGLTLKYNVGNDLLQQVLIPYTGNTSDISIKASSKRVKVSIDCYRRIIAIRTLTEYKSWSLIWDIIPQWKHIVSIPENVWSVQTLSAFHDSGSNISSQPINVAYNYLNQLSEISTEDIYCIPSALVNDLREEIIEIVRLVFSSIIIPKLTQAISRNNIPSILYLNPLNSGIDLTELQDVLNEFALFQPILNNHLKKIIGKGKEILLLRNSFVTGDGSTIINTIRGISLLATDDLDIVNATKYHKLFTAYHDLKESIYQDGVSRWNKLPGFMEFICNDVSLIEPLEILSDLDIHETLWPQFILLIKLLYSVRRYSLKNVYDQACNDITQAQTSDWWSALCNSIDLSKNISEYFDYHQAAMKELIHFVIHEIENILLEIKHRIAVSSLCLSCSKGGIMGTLSRLDYSLVDASCLISDLFRYRHDVVADTRDAQILADCDILVAIRESLLSDDWDKIGNIIFQYFKSSNNFSSCHSATKVEFTLWYHGYLDREAMKRLENIISINKIELDPDNDILFQSEDNFLAAYESLRETIQHVEQLQFRSLDCEVFLESVRHLHILRNAVYKNMWGSWDVPILRQITSNQHLSMQQVLTLLGSKAFSDMEVEFVLNNLVLAPWPKQRSTDMKLILDVTTVEDLISYYISNNRLNQLHPLIQHEIINASICLQERRLRVSLLVACLSGQISTVLGSIDASHVSTSLLAKAIWSIRTFQSSVPRLRYDVQDSTEELASSLACSKLSDVIVNWLEAAELLLHLRIAILSSKTESAGHHSILIEEYFEISSVERILLNLSPLFPREEIETTISGLFDLRNFNMLLKEFSSGRPMSYNGNILTNMMNYDHLLNALNHLKKIKIRSDRLDRLMFFGELTVYFRRALMNQRWDNHIFASAMDRNSSDGTPSSLQSVRQCLEEYIRAVKFFSSPVEGVPPIALIEDIRMIELEYQKRNLIRSFLAAFRSGKIDGQPFNLQLTHVSCDALNNQINRVKEWSEEIGEVGADLSLLLNAAEEIRNIRIEVMKLQGKFSKNREVSFNTRGSSDNLQLIDSVAASSEPAERDSSSNTQSNDLRLIDFEVLCLTIANEVMNTSIATVKTLLDRSKEGMIVQQWATIDNLMATIAYSHSVPALNVELSLLTAETFSRSFIKKMTDIFYDTLSFYSKDHLRSMPIDDTRKIMSIIKDNCATYTLRIATAFENASNYIANSSNSRGVLELIYHSAVILYHILYADISGNYETPDRQWNDVIDFSDDQTSNQVTCPDIDALVSSLHIDNADSYSIQSILRFWKRFVRSSVTTHESKTSIICNRMISNASICLHYAVEKVLLIREHYVIDLINYQEMSLLEQYTALFIDATADTSEAVACDRIDLDQMYKVKEQVERDGLYEPSMNQMYESYCHIVTLLQHLKNCDVIQAYNQLDSILCHSKRDYIELLRIRTSSNCSYPTHSRFQMIFETIMNYILDQYWIYLSQQALDEGYIQGEIFSIDISNIAYEKLELVLRYGDYAIPWSEKAQTLHRLCNLVKCYRKDVFNLTANQTFEVIRVIDISSKVADALEGSDDVETRQDEEKEANDDKLLTQSAAPINYPVRDIAILHNILTTVHYFLHDSASSDPSNPYSSRLFQEALLLKNHLETMIALTTLFNTITILPIAWNKGGLLLSQPIYQLWTRDYQTVSQYDIPSNPIINRGYVKVYQYLESIIYILDMIHSSSIGRSDRQVVIDIESLSLDQQISFDMKDIQKLLSDIDNVNAQDNMNMTFGTKTNVVTINNDVSYLSPGMNAFDELCSYFEESISAFESLDRHCVFLSSKVSSCLRSLNESLLHAVQEHRTLQDIQYLLSYYKIESRFIESTTAYEIYLQQSSNSSRGSLLARSKDIRLYLIRKIVEYDNLDPTDKDFNDQDDLLSLQKEIERLDMDDSFPWIGSWLTTRNAAVFHPNLSSEILDSSLYHIISRYLRTVPLSTSFGQLCRVVVRLQLELYLCVVCEDWSRGQVIAYVLCHLNWMDESNSVENVICYREYVDILTIHRVLEHNLFGSIFPPIIGWSMSSRLLQPLHNDGIDADSNNLKVSFHKTGLLYLQLNDVILLQAVEMVSEKFDHIVSSHDIIASLMIISKMMLNIMSAVRNDSWTPLSEQQSIASSFSLIETAVSSLSGSKVSSKIAKYLSSKSYNISQSVIELIDELKAYTSSVEHLLRPSLVSHIYVQIENLQRESNHRQIMSQITSYINDLSTISQWGKISPYDNLMPSNDYMQSLDHIINVFATNSPHLVALDYSFELIQLKQSANIMLAYLSCLQMNPFGEEVGFLLALMKHMSQLDDIYIIDENKYILTQHKPLSTDELRLKDEEELASLHTLSSDLVKSVSASYLEEYYCRNSTNVVLTIVLSNNNGVLSTVESVEAYTGGYSIDRLVRLRSEFIPLIQSFERNYLFQIIREKYSIACSSGSAAGSPGSLDVANISIVSLSDIASQLLVYGFVDDNLSNDAETPAAVLYRACNLLMRLRQSQKIRNISNIRAALDDIDVAMALECKVLPEYATVDVGQGVSDILSIDKSDVYDMDAISIPMRDDRTPEDHDVKFFVSQPNKQSSQGHKPCLLIEIVQKEIDLAINDWKQHDLIAKLEAGIVSSGIPIVDNVDDYGLPTSTCISEVNIDSLISSLKLAEVILPISQQALLYHSTATVVLTIRQYFKRREWNSLREYINMMNFVDLCDEEKLLDSKTMPIVSLAVPEIARARRYSCIYSATATAIEAYQSGRFESLSQSKLKSKAPEDILEKVSVKEIEKAYEMLSNIPINWRTNIIQRHYDSCKVLLGLRRNIVNKNWPAVYGIATMITNPSRCEIKKSFDDVISEANNALAFAAEDIASHALKQTLRVGKLTGEPGRLNIIPLCITHLISAINLSQDIGAKSKENLRLLNTVKLALRLRLAQSRDSWLSKTNLRSPDVTNSISKSDKLLPIEVEQAMLKYSNMTVEAAILEAETCVTIGLNDGSWSPNMILTSKKTVNEMANSSNQSQWMNKLFPSTNQKNSNSVDISASNDVLDPTPNSSPEAIYVTISPPQWMEAIDYFPKNNDFNLLGEHAAVFDEFIKRNESVEDILYEIEHDSNIALSSDLFDEIALARDEIRYRRIVFSLLVGLRSKGATGLPGALDISTINTSILSQVIAYAEQYPNVCNKPSSKCRYLLRDAKFLLTARLKRLQHDWKKLMKVVTTVKELNNLTTCPACESQPSSIASYSSIDMSTCDTVAKDKRSSMNSSSSPLMTYHPVFQPVWEEFRMYDADISFQLCLASYIEEMNRKIEYKSVGTSGNVMDMSPVLTLIELTRKTKALALIYPSTEYERLIEAMTLAVELRLRRIYEPNKSTKDLMDRTMSIRTRDIRLQLPSFVSFLLTDVTVMSSATDKQQQIQALELAIVTGQQYIRSPIGRINTNEIDNTTLQIIIQTSSPLLKTIGSKADLHLIDIAVLIVNIRKIVIANDWIQVKRVITENMTILSSSTLVKDEVKRLLIEADNNLCVKQFESVLMRGRYIDVVKIAKLIYRPKRKRLLSVIESSYLMMEDISALTPKSKIPFQDRMPLYDDPSLSKDNYTSTAAIQGSLDDAIPDFLTNRIRSKSGDEFRSAYEELETLVDSTKSISVLSDEASSYLRAGQLIIRMRYGIMNGQWDSVKNIVFVEMTNDFGLLPTIVMEEIRAVRHGLRYRDVITKLADGMLFGRVSGLPGEVNLHTVDFSLLQEALIESGVEDNSHDAIQDSNNAMKIMHNFASKLCNIRRAIKEGNWGNYSFKSIIRSSNTLKTRADLIGGKQTNDLKLSIDTERFIRGIEESVQNFIDYEVIYLPELKRLLQISDDEDSDYDIDPIHNMDDSDDDSDERKDQFHSPDRITLVPFQSMMKQDSHSKRKPSQYRNESKDSDWLVHQWEAVKAARNEVRLILWEIKERQLREKLIEAIERIPTPALRFASSLQSRVNNREDVRLSYRIKSHSESLFDRKTATNININADNVNTTIKPFHQQNLSMIHEIGLNENYFSSNEDHDPFMIILLQDTIEYIRSQYVTADVISEEVSLLLSTADILLKFRIAISNGVDLNEYKLLVEEALELREKGKISESAGMIELRSYMSASMTVEIVRNELIKALQTGKVSGYLDDLNIVNIETKSLSYWLSSSNILADTAQELAVGLIPLIREGELLLRLRNAVMLDNWSDLSGVWKSLFNSKGELREDVSFKYIQSEITHVYNSHRLHDLMKQLQSILDEDLGYDLEKKYSLLMVKSVHLGSVLGQLKELFAYRSDELIPKPIQVDSNAAKNSKYRQNSPTSTKSNSNLLPISPSNIAMKLFECGQITVHFWSAICHKHWGDDSLASGDLDNMSISTDPLLHVVTTRFIQENLSSSVLQSTSTNLKAFTSQPDSLLISLDSAHDFIESFLDVGASNDEKSLFSSIQQYTNNRRSSQTISKQKPQSGSQDSPTKQSNDRSSRKMSVRRVSLVKSNASGEMSSDHEEKTQNQNAGTTPSRERRKSVADALKESNGRAVNNSRLSSMNMMNRSNSIFVSIDRPNMTVLQILSSNDWKCFPIQIRRQFDVARNIVIDRALRLRLISCCSIGEVSLDHIGNIVVPDLNDSLELLHISLADESAILEEAVISCQTETNTIPLTWSTETMKWIRTSKILLSCRCAIVDYRIDDLLTELVSAGFGSNKLECYDVPASYISEATVAEFKIMEQFAIENVAEISIEEAIRHIVSLANSQLRLKGHVTINTTIFTDSIVQKIIDLREPIYKRRDVTYYYDCIVKFAEVLISALQVAVMGNRLQVNRARSQMIDYTRSSPFLLSECVDDIEELCDLLLQRAIYVSSTNGEVDNFGMSSESFTRSGARYSMDSSMSHSVRTRPSYGSSVLPNTEDLYSAPAFTSKYDDRDMFRLSVSGKTRQSGLKEGTVPGKKSLTKEYAKKLEKARQERRIMENMGSNADSQIMVRSSINSNVVNGHTNTSMDIAVHTDSLMQDASRNNSFIEGNSDNASGPFTRSTLRTLFGSI